MKRVTPLFLALALVFTAGPVLASAPEQGSLTIESQSVRGNRTWTPQSYPEIWLTPFSADIILRGYSPEEYPPLFLRFAPPEGACPMEFDNDEAVFLDHETLMLYGYYAYDRASFEVFLEKAEPEHTLADGSDGVAMFVSPDSRRARALLDIKEQFGKTAKLEIYLSDYSRESTAQTLAEMLRAEVERVLASMEYVRLDGFWAQGVFASVTLHAGRDPVSATVDTAGMTIVAAEEGELKAMRALDERNSSATSISLDTYSYVDANADKAADVTLADGSQWQVYNTDYRGYAALTVLEQSAYGKPLYLTVEIDAAPDAFMALLEEVAARITLTVE